MRQAQLVHGKRPGTNSLMGTHMVTRRTLEERMAALGELSGAELTAEALCEVRSALTGSNNILAAKAVGIVVARGLLDLVELLPAAFDRFMLDSLRKDKKCHAKIEIARALRELELGAASQFLAGSRLVQMEKAYGGPVDAAAPLRAECALGLAAMRHTEALNVLTDLLVDPEPTPRAAAARGLSFFGGEAAMLLLRLKVRTGDDDPEVLGECFNALLSLDQKGAVPLVVDFLQHADRDVAQYAALGLGEFGGTTGYEALVEYWGRTVRARDRAILVLPIALSRRDEARSLLLDVVRSADPELAARAVAGLRIFKSDQVFVDTVREIALGRRHPIVAKAYVDAFQAETP